MDKSKKSVYKYFIAINMMRRSRPSHLASLVLHGRTVQGLKDKTIAFTDTTQQRRAFISIIINVVLSQVKITFT